MNWFDVVILVFIVLGFIEGFRKGLIKELANLVGLILGIWIALKFSTIIMNYCFIQFPGLAESSKAISPQIVKIIAFVVVFIVVALLIELLGRLLHKVAETIALGGVNKVFGAVFGALKFVVVAGLIIYILNMFNILSDGAKSGFLADSFFYQYIEKIIPLFEKKESTSYIVALLMSFFQDNRFVCV
jgi:membrane protein required for colicin V production